MRPTTSELDPEKCHAPHTFVMDSIGRYAPQQKHEKSLRIQGFFVYQMNGK